MTVWVVCVTLWMINYLEWYLPWIILCGIVVFVYSYFEVCFCSSTHSTLVLSRRSIIPSSTCLLSVVLTCWERSLAKVGSLGLVSNHRNTVFSHFCYMFACCHFYYRITSSPLTSMVTWHVSDGLLTFITRFYSCRLVGPPSAEVCRTAANFP